MELSKLKYPWLREELISYLDGLANEQYQYDAWVAKKRPSGGYDELDYTIHFFYDDTDLACNPNSLIGEILIGAEEASAIGFLIKELDFLFEKYGTELTDSEYLSKEEWKAVVQAAKYAKQIIN